MAEQRPTRWQRARDDWHGLRLKREGVNLLIVPPLTAGAVFLFGSKQGAMDYLIGIGVAIALVLVVIPFAELAWRYAQAPVGELREEVGQLRGRVWELEKAAGVSTSDLRAAYADLRQELRDGRRHLEEAQRTGMYWKVTAPSPDDRAWKRHKGLLARQPGGRELLDNASEAYRVLQALLTARSMRMFGGGRKVREEDNLPGVISAVTTAEQAFEGAISELDRQAGAE